MWGIRAAAITDLHGDQITILERQPLAKPDSAHELYVRGTMPAAVLVRRWSHYDAPDGAELTVLKEKFFMTILSFGDHKVWREMIRLREADIERVLGIKGEMPLRPSIRLSTGIRFDSANPIPRETAP